MRKVLGWGGVFAAVVLIVFGIGAIVIGVEGRSTVQDTLEQEKIVGSPDMTPEGIREGAQAAGLSGVDLPDCSVADEPVNDGSSARCFADHMRIHALESSGGKTYAQLPRFATEDGAGTDDESKALKDDGGQPVSNPIRNVWINETALSTALNMAYMAEQVSLFGIVTGIAMILAGVGLGILSLFVFGLGRASRPDELPAA